jgi:hypothetical protein
MIEKDPSNIPLVTYLWVLALSVFSGFASFMRNLRQGRARVFNIVEFVGEIASSALAGLITFWLCQESGVSPLMTAVFVAISGHMGSKALALLEDWMERRFPEMTTQPKKRG